MTMIDSYHSQSELQIAQSTRNAVMIGHGVVRDEVRTAVCTTDTVACHRSATGSAPVTTTSVLLVDPCDRIVAAGERTPQSATLSIQ
jgi:hypothetical protein